jgi:hypothetical protein
MFTVLQNQLFIPESFLGLVFHVVSLVFAFSAKEKLKKKEEQSIGVAKQQLPAAALYLI